MYCNVHPLFAHCIFDRNLFGNYVMDIFSPEACYGRWWISNRYDPVSTICMGCDCLMLFAHMPKTVGENVPAIQRGRITGKMTYGQPHILSCQDRQIFKFNDAELLNPVVQHFSAARALQIGFIVTGIRGTQQQGHLASCQWNKDHGVASFLWFQHASSFMMTVKQFLASQCFDMFTSAFAVAYLHGVQENPQDSSLSLFGQHSGAFFFVNSRRCNFIARVVLVPWWSQRSRGKKDMKQSRC